jgi:organic radical activating enzyme
MEIDVSRQGCPFSSYALELHAVRHCNLSCKGCSQSSPLLSEAYEDVEVMQQALSNLSGALICQKLQVLGGEPLLHPRLIDILRVASKSGLAPSLSIKTNGLLLSRMPEAFWQLTNHVIVSVYPATDQALSRERKRLDERASAHGTVLSFRPFSQFRYITKSQATASPALVTHTFQRCEYKRFTHSLRAGRLYRCAPSVNLASAQHLHEEDRDSIDALSPLNLGTRLTQFLSSNKPLNSCCFCLGSSGSSADHSLNNERRLVARQRYS